MYICLCICRESESKQLKEQIDFMTDTIQKERERLSELELKSKHFSFGPYKPEDQVFFCVCVCLFLWVSYLFSVVLLCYFLVSFLDKQTACLLKQLIIFPGLT